MKTTRRLHVVCAACAGMVLAGSLAVAGLGFADDAGEAAEGGRARLPPAALPIDHLGKRHEARIGHFACKLYAAVGKAGAGE